MSSLKTPLIIFALVLLLLVGGVLLLGNPGGTVDNGTLVIDDAILQSLNINKDELNACIDSEEFTDRINRDAAQARELNITGTPAILLLNRETNLGVLVRGAYPYEPLNESIKVLREESVSEGDIAYENADMNITLQVQKFEGLGLVSDDHIRGNPNAKMAMIEYSDLDCQYCAAFHGIAIQLVNDNLGELSWVYRHFPLISIHPNTMRKALSTECAEKLAGPDGFWGFVDSYFAKIISQQ